MRKLLIYFTFLLLIISCSDLDLNNLECENGDACPENSICVNSKCTLESDIVFCTGDDSCRGGEICETKCIDPRELKPKCEEDFDCNDNQYCDEYHKVCRDNSCDNNQDCAENGYCYDNTCFCYEGFEFDDYRECVAID